MMKTAPSLLLAGMAASTMARSNETGNLCPNLDSIPSPAFEYDLTNRMVEVPKYTYSHKGVMYDFRFPVERIPGPAHKRPDIYCALRNYPDWTTVIGDLNKVDGQGKIWGSYTPEKAKDMFEDWVFYVCKSEKNDYHNVEYRARTEPFYVNTKRGQTVDLWSFQFEEEECYLRVGSQKPAARRQYSGDSSRPAYQHTQKPQHIQKPQNVQKPQRVQEPQSAQQVKYAQ